MKNVKKLNMIIALSTVVLFGCDKDDDDNYPENPGIEATTLKSSGDAATIAGTIDQFRVLLGDPLNTTPDQTTGRREVNWDGAPAGVTNNNTFPLDFFNNTDPAGPNGRKRGLVYLDTGSPLRLDSSNFTELDPSYADEFIPFSAKKSIIAANSNISEIAFKIAGSNTNAFVKGFGIVFLDVDDANSTYLEFFNGNKNLGKFKAPARTVAGGLSFLGVHFSNEKITRVRIVAGNAALGNGTKDMSDGGNKDLVAYDDFFYDEPKNLN